MAASATVLLTLIVYQLILLGVGVWATGRVTDEEDYFLGGRRLGAIVASLSYSASSSSAYTLLGVSGAAYGLGLSALWIAAGSVLGAVVAWFVVASGMMAFSRRHGTVTIADFMAHDADDVWRQRIVVLTSTIVVFSFAFYVAAQFQGAGSTFSTAFGLPLPGAIILGGMIVLIYTWLGGFWAVSVTDAVQGFLMLVTAVLLPIAAVSAVGGVPALADRLGALDAPDLLRVSGQHVGLGAVGFILGSLGIGLGPVGQPHLLVRFMAVRDAAALRRARLLTLFWFTIVFAGMFVAGLAGRVLLPSLPASDAESIFFLLANSLFSPLIAGIMLAAVLSAIMSTADSQLLVGASSIAYDLGLSRRFPRTRLLVPRLTIAALAVVSILIALYIPTTIFRRVLFAWSALGAAFGPTVVLRIVGIRLSAPAVFASMIVGFGSAAMFFAFSTSPGQILERVVPFALGATILWVWRRGLDDGVRSAGRSRGRVAGSDGPQ